MKEKLVLFITGLLVGAIISTGVFYVYSVTNNSSCNSTSDNLQMPGGNPPSMQDFQGNENGQPPARPGENNTQNNIQSNNS